MNLFNLFKKDRHKKGYVIHKTETKYLICRILNEYADGIKAREDLVCLLTHEITEDDLLNEFDQKQSW